MLVITGATWVQQSGLTVQAIIRAVCAIIDAFHFEVPAAGDAAGPADEAGTDADAADGDTGGVYITA